MSSTTVTDRAAADIGTLAKLTALNLGGTAVTDAGLKPLAGAPHSPRWT